MIKQSFDAGVDAPNLYTLVSDVLVDGEVVDSETTPVRSMSAV